MSTDWEAWHRGYDEPGSDLSRRRRSVQSCIDAWWDARTEADLRVVSACSGDGLDLIEVLARREDAGRAAVRLLELDPRLAARAEQHVARHGLDRVEVVRADAGTTASYGGAVPADLVLMCGVFGNVTDEDVRGTVAALPSLCAHGATVVWTRGRFSSGDLTPEIRAWFAEEGFAEVSFDAPADATYCVGAHRLDRRPVPLPERDVFLTFVR